MLFHWLDPIWPVFSPSSGEEERSDRVRPGSINEKELDQYDHSGRCTGAGEPLRAMWPLLWQRRLGLAWLSHRGREAADDDAFQWNIRLTRSAGTMSWFLFRILRLKCLSVLLYGLEVCSLSKAQIRSLDYAVSSCYRKIFNVKSNENVRLCMDMFNCDDVATLLTKRKQKFASSFARIGSILCELVVVISD